MPAAAALMKAEGVEYSPEIVRENPIPYQAAGQQVNINQHPWILSKDFAANLKNYSPAMAGLIEHRQQVFRTHGDPSSPVVWGMARLGGGFRLQSDPKVVLQYMFLRAYQVWYVKINDDARNTVAHSHFDTEELVINGHNWKLFRTGEQVASGTIN